MIKNYFFLLIVLTISQISFGASGVKCRVYQESVGGVKRLTNKKSQFEISQKKKKQSTYLKTVVSELDAELIDDGVKLALSNGLGKHRKILKFKKGSKSLSKTFIYPSDNPQIIRNKVRVDCQK